MPSRSLAALEEQVGTTHRTVEGFQIETGKVDEFARAIRDPTDVYLDVDTAHDAGYDRIPAPPTFTRSSFFPRYRPPGIDVHLGFDLGFDPEYVLHGEQHYEYDRPLFVGDELHGETTLERVFQREGESGGAMTFAVLRTDFYDSDGDRVQSARITRIETDGAVADAAGGTPTTTIEQSEDSVGTDPGDPAPTVTTSPLERQDFVRYAGASGDFNPVHYDEPYATDAGHPSVFAQGMFSAGVLSRTLREWVGLDGIESFRTRFTARAFPGDKLITRGVVDSIEETGDGHRIDASLEVVTGDGKRVVEGSATLTN